MKRILAVLAAVVAMGCSDTLVTQPGEVRVDSVFVVDTVTITESGDSGEEQQEQQEEEEQEQEEEEDSEDSESENGAEEDDGRRGKCGLVGGPSPCNRGKGKGVSGG